MKQLKWLVLPLLALTVLSACSLLPNSSSQSQDNDSPPQKGSSQSQDQPNLRGKWKATKQTEEEIDLVFNRDKGQLGEQEFDYTVDDSGVQDLMPYFCITVSDTYHYTIVFPDTSSDIAVLIEPDDYEEDPFYGEMLYAMNRREYPEFQDYLDKYLNRE